MSLTNGVIVDRKVKVLCLHGWRTSGRILSMQTAAMQYHTPIDFHFLDAPYEAVGPPDKGIATYYPNNSYYEWFIRKPEDKFSGLRESIALLLRYIQENGPFDGLLGFSQGASMVTRLASLQQSKADCPQGGTLCKFVILIGGVTPGDSVPVSSLDVL
jgi:predicted esterase